MAMLTSRTTRLRLRTAFLLVAAVSIFASGCAGDDPSGGFVLVQWMFGIAAIVATLRLGSNLGLMTGGFAVLSVLFLPAALWYLVVKTSKKGADEDSDDRIGGI